jgi:uroporphyrinogen-III decarboxylase
MPSAGKKKRVIIAAQSNDHSARLAGIPSERFFTDAEIFTRVQLLVSEYYGFDAPNNTWDVYNIEAEAMGQKIVFPPDGIPDVDRTQPLIDSPASLDKVRIPDPYKSGRMPWVHAVNKKYIELTGRPAHVYFCAPFSLAVNVRGYENLIMDIDLNPDFAHQLFEFLCDKVIAPFIQAMRSEIDQPNALADGNDAWASPPLINLQIMENFVIRYAQRLREIVGAKVVTRGNWGDSKSNHPEFAERFMALKLKACPGFLSVLDPDLYKLGPQKVKAFAQKHEAYVTAGVDATLLQKGPVEAIVARIKQYIDAMARDGRGAIYLNQIPGDTPPEHIHAAVAACRAYGQFPIPENLEEVEVDLPERECFSEFLQHKGETLDI